MDRRRSVAKPRARPASKQTSKAARSSIDTSPRIATKKKAAADRTAEASARVQAFADLCFAPEKRKMSDHPGRSALCVPKQTRALRDHPYHRFRTSYGPGAL